MCDHMCQTDSCVLLYLGEEYSAEENKSCGNCDGVSPSYGPNGERWQTSARDDVQSCKDTCSANAECGGFNFVESNQKCYFRNNDMTCRRSPDTNRDCYIKSRENPAEESTADESKGAPPPGIGFRGVCSNGYIHGISGPQPSASKCQEVGAEPVLT